MCGITFGGFFGDVSLSVSKEIKRCRSLQKQKDMPGYSCGINTKNCTTLGKLLIVTNHLRFRSQQTLECIEACNGLE